MALAATRAPARSGPLGAAPGTPNDPGSRLGRVLGSYRLVTELGQGGMGTVYYAEHVAIGRRAAVKVLHHESAGDPDLVERFFDEARAAHRIGHLGIVDMLDLGSDGDLHYLVMELLEGETLGARLERVKRLAPEEVIRLLGQACEALAAAHDRGIVHRDLKPENLFLVKERGGDRTKILDFGIAKLTGRDDVRRTRTGHVIGTPTYMSPEQCVGDRDLDARSDVYSLGVVAFEALSGRPPFVSDAVGRLIVSHSHEPPPLLSSIEPSVPPGLEEVVMRTLGKRRDERYANMRELRRALEGALLPRLPAHLAVAVERGRAPRQAPPTAAEIERIEEAQTRSVGTRLRDIIHTRLEEDRLPLPSMPMVVMRALELLRDEGVGLGRVARMLETDPLVVPEVLKVANSAAYAGCVRVSGLDTAVARLGARNLRTMLTERAAREVFSSRDPAIARSFRSVWEHCVAVGTLSRSLAADAPLSLDDVYLGGLLHDVGKPVVGVLLLETERSLLAKLGVQVMGGSLWMKIVEDSHAEVGVALARKWCLPSAVIGVIGTDLGTAGHPPESLAARVAYGHALAVSIGHNGGLPAPDDAEQRLIEVRERVRGSVERERTAVAALAEVLRPGTSAAGRAARATVTSRRRG